MMHTGRDERWALFIPMQDNIFEKIVSWDNLWTAYKDASMMKGERPNVLRFRYRVGNRLAKLRREIIAGTYVHGPYKEFVVTDSKKRCIQAGPFPDRVVHHAVHNIIEPIFERHFIRDSYACRKGKGVHRAFVRLEKFVDRLRGATGKGVYCLKCDVAKYFASVDHEVLMRLLSRRIKDGRTMRLLRAIVESLPAGIPIGNLTSQLFANIYLNEMDHFAKETLGCKYYVRYMDDFLILDTDKGKLVRLRERVRIFLRNNLRVQLHPRKAEIIYVPAGLDFLGYRLDEGRRKLRSSTVRRYMKRAKTQVARGADPADILRVWKGYSQFAASWRLREKMYQKLMRYCTPPTVTPRRAAPM